ncbi:hypothetical protein HD599_000967 [Conyzicola lurida]|uniref:Uncharacterized protein n=1 Tax=Conyzicola lurida TaxID=1172621 RepID=A0A841AJP3_9MICO|nr:hypothetical protein [Conyzicola lurida]
MPTSTDTTLLSIDEYSTVSVDMTHILVAMLEGRSE